MKRVMIFGTFDFLHAGHFFLFEQAAALGDYLIVVVARDTRVLEVKGKAPIHPERERVHMLQHIDYIDEAILGDETDVYAPIMQYTPDIIALGYDQGPFTENLEEVVRTRGIQATIVRLKPHGHLYKSSMVHQI